MALGSQPKVKRNRTGVPKGIKKRVILQFDDESPSVPTTSRLDDQRRALVAQQSLILSPPRLSTVVDNSRNDDNRARTDVASLNDKVPVGEEEVGRLVTVVGQDQHVIRIKARERQFTIGRHRSADFIIDSPAVSNVHGKIFAHTCDTGDTLVCYEDVSRSGTLYNDEFLINKDAVILSHGDTILIDDREFFYFHFANEHLREDPVEEDFWYEDPRKLFPRHVEQFQITKRTLGSGSYAIVHLAVDIMTGRQMACKVIKKKVLAERNIYDKIEEEIKILTELKHANILSFVDACHDEVNWYLMLELCIGGDLFSYVARKDKLSGSESLFISYQLLLSLDYLHNTHKVAHRDIKPENVLLRNRGPYPHVLISYAPQSDKVDLMLSTSTCRDFGTIARDPQKPCVSFLGTVNYWSPECFTGTYMPQELDCFSLGCTIYIMLGGVHPFRRCDQATEKLWLKSSGEERVEESLRLDLQLRLHALDKAVAKEILNGCPRYHIDLKNVDKDGVNLIRGLLTPTARFRLTIRGALTNAWITKHKVELETLYERNVRNRQDTRMESVQD